MAFPAQALSSFEAALKLSTVKSVDPVKMVASLENENITLVMSPKVKEMVSQLPGPNSEGSLNLLDMKKHFNAMEARGYTKDSASYQADAAAMFHAIHSLAENTNKQINQLLNANVSNPQRIQDYQERANFYERARDVLVSTCEMKPSQVLNTVIALGEKHSDTEPAPAIAALYRKEGNAIAPSQLFDKVVHPLAAKENTLSKSDLLMYHIATGTPDKLAPLLNQYNPSDLFKQKDGKSNETTYAEGFTKLAASLYTHVKTNPESPVNFKEAWDKLKDSEVLSPALKQAILTKVRDPSLRATMQQEFNPTDSASFAKNATKEAKSAPDMQAEHKKAPSATKEKPMEAQKPARTFQLER